ncbi:MAG: four helix bundle protein [Pseudomonadota bacterium]
MKSFEDLEAWQQARKLVSAIYQMTSNENLARDYGLSGQSQRAAVSIMSNIAEGFERMHVQEKIQFYNIARASAGEVRSLLYVVEDCYPTLAPQAISLRKDVAGVGKLITGLIKSTQRRKNG